MKTLLKKLTIITLTTISLSTVFLTQTAFAQKEHRAILLENNFRRILVSGNVELLIVQNKNEGVVYHEANEGKAKVEKEGDIIRITAAGKHTAKLILYVNNFYRIDASGNATVKNYGELDLKYLQIFLKDNALADINSNTNGLYTILKDNANLKLNGFTNNHILTISKSAKITIDRFYAATVQNNPEEFLAESK